MNVYVNKNSAIRVLYLGIFMIRIVDGLLCKKNKVLVTLRLKKKKTIVLLDGFYFSLFFFFFPPIQIISYDSPRGGVNVVTEKGTVTTSHLLIQEARVEDNGRYQCNPSNAQPKSINVHVLNGKRTHLKIGQSDRLGGYLYTTTF